MKAASPGVAGGQPLFKPMPATVVSTEPLPDHMAIGASSRDIGRGATERAVRPAGRNDDGCRPRPQPSREPPATTAPKAERRARPVGPGTPRYNLLLSLGGLY